MQALWCQPKCFYAMADHLLVLERDGSSLGALIPPPEIPVDRDLQRRPASRSSIAAHRMLAERSTDGRHVIAARSVIGCSSTEPDLVVALVRELVERVSLPR